MEPPCVEDILSQLLAFPLAFPRSDDGDALNNAGVQFSQNEIPVVSSSFVSTHRVQVSIRGQRYEMSMEVALASCLSFFVFFHWPFRVGSEGGDAALYSGDITDAKQTLQTVGDVVAAAAAPQDVTEEPHLLGHYTRVVEPVLRTFFDHCVATPHVSRTAHTEGECTSAAEAEDAAPLPCLPPLPRPVRIVYDASTRVWKFEFAARLTGSEVAAGCAQLQRSDPNALVSSAAAERNDTVTTDELNRSPFLLLQNDYMGVLLVFLRRCTKVRAERRAASAAGAATDTLPRYPILPIRWEEMNYDDQLSFVQLLRCFGVVSLARTYTHPTAPQSTSLYIGARAGSAAAAAVSSLTLGEDACLMRARAAKSVDTEQPGAVQDDEDESDAFVLRWKGCARCGVSEHATEECHHV